MNLLTTIFFVLQAHSAVKDTGGKIEIQLLNYERRTFRVYGRPNYSFSISCDLKLINRSNQVLRMPDKFISGPAGNHQCNISYELKICDSNCESRRWGADINVGSWPRNSIQLQPGNFLLVTVGPVMDSLDQSKKYYVRFTLKRRSWAYEIPDIDEDIISDWFLLDNNKLKLSLE